MLSNNDAIPSKALARELAEMEVWSRSCLFGKRAFCDRGS